MTITTWIITHIASSCRLRQCGWRSTTNYNTSIQPAKLRKKYKSANKKNIQFTNCHIFITQ